MASVHLARFLGKAGFARTVAIKRPLPALQQSADFRRLATREALLAARVQHPNVVSTFDVIDSDDEFLIVMQYVHGEPLSALTALAQQRGERVPVDIVVTLLGGVLRGLSAVHQARDEHGRVLGLIHRDVSPQNILCGVDGVARLADFGLAKAAGYTAPSNAAEFKGKLTYASPEQVELGALTLATDLYAVGVVLWEMLSGERMYRDLTAPELVARLLRGDIVPPSRFVSGLPPSLDGVVLRALAREPQQRYESALAMAAALESCVRPASVEASAAWVCDLASESLQVRARLVIDAESETSPSQRHPAQVSTQPLDPTVLAGNAEDWASSERDRGLRGPSLRAGALTNFSLRLFAMAAGVVLVWFLGEQLLPSVLRPMRSEPPLGVRADDALAVPAPSASAVLSLRARGDGEGAALAPAAVASDAGASSSASRIDATNAARRPELARARSARPPSGTPSTWVDCSPPFSLDAEGIRHMKPGCK